MMSKSLLGSGGEGQAFQAEGTLRVDGLMLWAWTRLAILGNEQAFCVPGLQGTVGTC